MDEQLDIKTPFTKKLKTHCVRGHQLFSDVMLLTPVASGRDHIQCRICAGLEPVEGGQEYQVE